MGGEISGEFRKKRLIKTVAITVVLLAAFMGVVRIKDENLVKSMQLAKADVIDLWSEYRASQIKQSLVESMLQQAQIHARVNSAARKTLGADTEKLRGDIERYRADADKLQQQAKAKEAEYGKLDFHDNQFDLSSAAMAIAIACAAVAALAESWSLLLGGWVFGAFGLLFGMAGFAGWQIHPDWLVALLS